MFSLEERSKNGGFSRIFREGDGECLASHNTGPRKVGTGEELNTFPVLSPPPLTCASGLYVFLLEV